MQAHISVGHCLAPNLNGYKHLPATPLFWSDTIQLMEMGEGLITVFF